MGEQKAWIVWDTYREGEVLDWVLAETAGKAKAKSELYGEVNYVELRCRRVPALDGGPLTDERIWKAGDGRWLVRCSECYLLIWDNPFFNENGTAFCDEGCYNEYLIDHAA